MIKKLFPIIILVFLIVPIFALTAYKTEVTLTTEPNYNVNIIAKDSENENLVQSFTKVSDSTGIVKVSVSSIVSSIKLDVTVSGTRGTKNQDFGPYKVETPISIELKIPVEPEVEENTTEDSGLEVTVQEAEKNKNSSGNKITGFSTFENISISPIVYYIVGIVLILGILVFLVVRFRGSLPSFSGTKIPQQITTIKASEKLKQMKEERENLQKVAEGIKEDDIDNDDVDKVTELERRILDITKEISKIKNKARIKEARKRLEEDKERLEKLELGEEEKSEN